MFKRGILKESDPGQFHNFISSTSLKYPSFRSKISPVKISHRKKMNFLENIYPLLYQIYLTANLSQTVKHIFFPEYNILLCADKPKMWRVYQRETPNRWEVRTMRGIGVKSYDDFGEWGDLSIGTWNVRKQRMWGWENRGNWEVGGDLGIKLAQSKSLLPN